METGCPQTLIGNGSSVVFNDWSDDSEQGGVFQITRITGADGADVRNPQEPRPQRDGAIIHPFYRGGRTFALEGRIIADDKTARTEMEDLLRTTTQSILREDGTYTWEPSISNVPTTHRFRSITCRLFEPEEIADENSAVKSFVIVLFSEDPYARSTLETEVEITVSGSDSYENLGNAPYWPIVEVHGPLTSFVLSNDTLGLSIDWDGSAITVGNKFIVRMNFETITLNTEGGASVLGDVDFSVSDFWYLDTGVNDLSFTATGDGAATKAVVLAHDGWVG